MSYSLFRKKTIERIELDAKLQLADHVATGGQLRRTLGVFDLTLMGIAAIVGAGIFAMIGQASFDDGRRCHGARNVTANQAKYTKRNPCFSAH